MNVNTNKKQIILLTGVVLVLAFIAYLIFALKKDDESNTFRGSEINEIVFDPHPSSYKLVLKLKGELLCPISYQILMDGKVYSTYSFESAEIDTPLIMDWYQNQLSFIVQPDSCFDNNFATRVRLYR